MAGTAFGTNDPLTIKKWSHRTFKDMLDDISFTPMMGSEEGAVIQIDKELTKGKGDTITMRMRARLTGAGIGDDGKIQGNEEPQRARSLPVVIHERGHGVVSEGKMSEKRTATTIREDGRAGLGEWGADRIEYDIIQALCGLYNEPGIQTVNVSAPTPNRILYLGQSAAGTLTTDATTDATLGDGGGDDPLNYLFGTKVITEAVAYAKSYKFPKATIRNPKNHQLVGKYYIIVAHPLSFKAMRAETGETGWSRIAAQALERSDKHPIFEGALGMWDGAILIESNKMPRRVGAGGTFPAEGFLLNAGLDVTTDPAAPDVTIGRALLLGGKAGVFAWGQLPGWYEYYDDCSSGTHGRHPGVATDMIYGVRKTRFNDHGLTTSTQEDYATLCIDHCINPLGA